MNKKKSFSDVAEHLSRQRKKYEVDLESSDQSRRNSARRMVARIDDNMNQLFELQETQKAENAPMDASGAPVMAGGGGIMMEQLFAENQRRLNANKSGFDWNNVTTAIPALTSTAGFFMNRAAIKGMEAPPEPVRVAPTKLNPALDVSADRARIARGKRTLYKSADQMTGRNAAQAAKTSAFTRGLEADNQLSQRATNYRRQVENQQANLDFRRNVLNTQASNAYRSSVNQFENMRRSSLSNNVGDFMTKLSMVGKDYQTNALEEKKLEIMKNAYAPGLLGRAMGEENGGAGWGQGMFSDPSTWDVNKNNNTNTPISANNQFPLSGNAPSLNLGAPPTIGGAQPFNQSAPAGAGPNMNVGQMNFSPAVSPQPAQPASPQTPGQAAPQNYQHTTPTIGGGMPMNPFLGIAPDGTPINDAWRRAMQNQGQAAPHQNPQAPWTQSPEVPDWLQSPAPTASAQAGQGSIYDNSGQVITPVQFSQGLAMGPFQQSQINGPVPNNQPPYQYKGQKINPVQYSGGTGDPLLNQYPQGGSDPLAGLAPSAQQERQTIPTIQSREAAQIQNTPMARELAKKDVPAIQFDPTKSKAQILQPLINAGATKAEAEKAYDEAKTVAKAYLNQSSQNALNSIPTPRGQPTPRPPATPKSPAGPRVDFSPPTAPSRSVAAPQFSDPVAPSTIERLTSPAQEFIMAKEEFRAKPYYFSDTEESQGIVTRGYGETIKLKAGETIDDVAHVTEPDARKQVTKRLSSATKEITSIEKESGSKLNENQKIAVTSLLDNIGTGDLWLNSKARKALIAGDMAEFRKQAFDAVEGFVKEEKGMDPLRGLVIRRNEEDTIFAKI